jgi:hypothetical protein
MDLGKIGDTIKSLAAALNEKAGPLADTVLSRIPEEKRRPVLLCLGGMVVLFICLIVILLAVNPGRAGAKEVREPVETALLPEELFFPGEPDFVPSLLLQREPRRFWTVEDVRPFWKDPGSLGRDRWRDEMGAVIDKLMEGIP